MTGNDWMGQVGSAGDSMADGMRNMAPFILAIALGLVMAFSCADNPANAPGTRQPEPQESEQAEAKQKDKAGEDV
jgi:hypothetical protein